MSDELSQAKDARDAVIASYCGPGAWHPDVVGVGIGRESGHYVVIVDVLAPIDGLPTEACGVPVRVKTAGRPVAYGRSDE